MNGRLFGICHASSFREARLEKEWIAILAQDRITLRRRYSDGLPRRRSGGNGRDRSAGSPQF